MPIIKRYSNRKLYDTEAKRYITLDGVADLIRQGSDVQVIDHETGEDITALVQAQTIFELEKKLKGGMPGAVLTHLIRAGNDTLSQMRRMFIPDEPEEHVNAEIQRRMHVLVERGELEALQAQRLSELLIGVGGTVEPTEPIGDAELSSLLQARGIPSKEDWQSLLQKIDVLSAELDQLNPKRPPRPTRKSTRSRRK